MDLNKFKLLFKNRKFVKFIETNKYVIAFNDPPSGYGGCTLGVYSLDSKKIYIPDNKFSTLEFDNFQWNKDKDGYGYILDPKTEEFVKMV